MSLPHTLATSSQEEIIKSFLFDQKAKLLSSMNVLDDKALSDSIEQIQKIRNYYAHNLLQRNEMDQKIMDHIRSLRNSMEKKPMPIYGTKVKPELAFTSCVLNTFIHLQIVKERIEQAEV
jgi:ubiquinone biosynthesis protein COQ9